MTKNELLLAVTKLKRYIECMSDREVKEIVDSCGSINTAYMPTNWHLSSGLYENSQKKIHHLELKIK
jgi:hypothetical protein